MGFLYDALAKSVGASPLPARRLRASSTSGDSSRATGDAGAVPCPAPSRFTPQNRLVLRHPVEGLIAQCSASDGNGHMAALEQCRVLRMRLWQQLQAKAVGTLLITSALEQEGKTFISVNLAFSLSQLEGCKVLLVDANLRKPSIATFLTIPRAAGLNSIVLNETEIADVTWEISPSLHVIPTEEIEEDAARHLYGQRLLHFLKEAKARYSVVLLDGPPLLPIADAQVLHSVVDGTVMVVKAGGTSFDVCSRAGSALGSKLIGTVLNGTESPHAPTRSSANTAAVNRDD